MLRHILFDLSLFATEAERANSQKRVLILLNALTWCNQLWLRSHPDTPLIYQSNITYKIPQQFERANLPEVDTVRAWLEKKSAPDPVMTAFKEMADQLGGGECFREIPRIRENGGGDCDNVACWRAAELRELGINAVPYITWRFRADGGTTYHVIVRWPDGTAEDPSLLLGMPEPYPGARAEEIDKLAERTADYVKGVLSGLRQQTSVEGVGAQGSLPSDFGKGIQYQPVFWSDDSYADWSPTRPQAFYYNPQYPGGLVANQPPGGGPLFNALWRDPDDVEDRLDRFDGAGSLRRRLMQRGQPWYASAHREMAQHQLRQAHGRRLLEGP